MRWIATAAWLLHVMFGGLCMTADSAHAAEEEARVLILNGTDPYLPAYLEIDSAMRASLAQEDATAHRASFPNRSMRSASRTEAFEPELAALLAKKYKDLRSTWSWRSVNWHLSSSNGTARSFGRAPGWCFPAGLGRSSNPRSFRLTQRRW